MPVFRKDGKAILFVHVPKAGGTSIEEAFFKAGWEVDLLDRGGPGSLNRFRKCSPQHMHAKLLAEHLNLSSFDAIFMTVRDPMARFRSEVAMFNPDMGLPWSDSAESFTEKRMRTLSADPYVGDNHMRPQHEYYIPGSYVFRLEDGLPAAIRGLAMALDLRISFDIPHKTSRRGSIPSSQIVVPDRWANCVKALYRRDYLDFGYSGT